MKIVPSLPPLTEPIAPPLEAGPTDPVARSRPVQPRSLPAQVNWRYRPVEEAARPDGQPGHERRRLARRIFCRRAVRGQVLLDTRAGTDRRERSRRSSDQATSISIEA